MHTVYQKIQHFFLRVSGLAAEEEETNQTPSWKDETSTTHTPTQTNRKISRTGSIPVIQPSGQSSMDLADLMESRELAELSNEVPIEKLASPNDLRARKTSDEEDLDSWDALYNETGDLLRPEALEEVTPSIALFFLCSSTKLISIEI